MTVTISLVQAYLQAAASLYGRIRLDALFNIFNHHNPGMVTADAFLQMAQEACASRKPFCIIGDDDIYRADISVRDMERWLVHRQYCYATWDGLLTLECSQEGKPVRLFSREEMLSHANPAYIPDTHPFCSLSQMLQNHTDGSVPLQQLLSQALALARNDCDAPDFLKEMQRLGCRFGSLEDRIQAACCYKGVYDTVPKPIHNGYSERELQTLPIGTKPLKRYYLWFCPPIEDDGFHLESARLMENVPNTGQTEYQRFLYRCTQDRTFPARMFDPCQCSSGLYYTDCCGKR